MSKRSEFTINKKQTVFLMVTLMLAGIDTGRLTLPLLIVLCLSISIIGFATNRQKELHY